MTRPFGLSDLGLLWAMRGQGLVLDMQRAVLGRANPLHAALAGLLPARHSGATRTYVFEGRHAPERGFLQVLTCPARHEWLVIYLIPWATPTGLAGDAGWAGALAELCVLAREWGAWRVRAGVAAGSAEEETFRQAGFIPYTREEVYCLQDAQAVGGDAEGSRSASWNTSTMRAVCEEDAWPLTHLVGHVVPPPVQYAEGLIASGALASIPVQLGSDCEQGYVLDRGGELGAYAGLSRGHDGAWARVLLHPDARQEADRLVQNLIAIVSPAPALYCTVRDYQSGLRSVLAAMGFGLVGVQTWLVKHTARPAECRSYRQLAVLNKRKDPVAKPLHPANDVVLELCSWAARERCAYEYSRTGGITVGSD